MGQFSAEKPVPPGSTLSGNQHLRQPLQTLRLLRGIFAQKVTDPEILKLVNRTEETLDVIAGMLELDP